MINNNIELLIPELRPEVELRLRKILPLMEESGTDAMLLASNANVFYMAGRFFRGYIYVNREGKIVYFLIRPNCFGIDGREVVEIRKPEMIPAELERLGFAIPVSLGLELDTLSYSEVQRLSRLYPEAKISNASDVMRRARMTKTPYELRLMREDGEHQMAAYSRITGLYKRDMTDVEFQVEIERALRLEGNLGFLRTSGNLMEINLGSVISGDNADAPSPYDFAMGGAGVSPALPCGACGDIMKPGQTVMVDMNGCFNGWQTDMTRVWTIGDVDPLAREAHECSRRILRELERIAVPGVEVRELFDRAHSIVEEEGLEQYFMGHRQQAAFIGHGVGIELNEAPAITPKCRILLEAGMTLAIEPKFVIPGVGAVGVENTYVVTPDGLNNLTPFPEEMTDLI
ncbi:MAG: Xaa-Pro peptidase family protein [Muribaculaceae bacterium]|nr:Xaa-Pro peptidase family protein [Muribaculaceae bacterium]